MTKRERKWAGKEKWPGLLFRTYAGNVSFSKS